MVLLTAGALVVGGILTLFTVSAVATLAHWVAVAGGLAIMAGLTYQLIENDYLDFLFEDSDVLEMLSAGILSSWAGFVGFRILESVFAAVGFGGALIVSVLVVASIVFSPALVAQFLIGVVEVVSELLGGE